MGVSDFTPLNTSPANTKAHKFPAGIESPQITVTKVRSLSKNHLLQNWVITLKNSGAEMLSMVFPIRIDQNYLSWKDITRIQPPIIKITQAIRSTQWDGIVWYM